MVYHFFWMISMSEEMKEESENDKDSRLFLMVLFGVLLPLYEIVTLLSIVATTVDPLFPNLNTILKLLAPALFTLLFAFMMYIDLSEKPRRLYILIGIIIGMGAFLSTFFMYPIIGYVDETNLWGLVNINITLYFGSVILIIYRFHSEN